MRKDLNTVLQKIGEKYGENISSGSRFYIEVDIGLEAKELGYSDLREEYRDIYAMVPLRQPVDGMKVRVDGRTFVNYDQFESGVVVPNYVSREADLPYKTFIPNDSMILNFT
jgi:hypothetical protein